MSGSIRYYVMVGEEQKGPYTLGQLQAMWRAGSLTVDTHYWSEGQSKWTRLGTILELLEPPSSRAPRYAVASPVFSPSPIGKRGIGTRLGLGCGVVFALLLAVFLIGLISSDNGSSRTQNYKSLTYKHSYFDVVTVLGHPDKEIEERDVPVPNIVLGYAREKWIVYVMYSDRSFDKSRSHYLGIISTDGTVIHAADEKCQTVLESLAYAIKHDVR